MLTGAHPIRLQPGRQVDILAAIDAGMQWRSEIARYTGLSPTEVTRVLAKLAHAGVVKCVGGRGSGGWVRVGSVGAA